jgi:hypothetical protein
MARPIATPVSKIRLLDFLLHCDKNLNILHNRNAAACFRALLPPRQARAFSYKSLIEL